MSGVVNVGGGESRGGECRTIIKDQPPELRTDMPETKLYILFHNFIHIDTECSDCL